MLMWSFGPTDLLEWGVHPVIVILLLPVIIGIILLSVRLYVSRLLFRCTECGCVFRPKFSRTLLGLHDERGREQYCPCCKKITYCLYQDR